MSTYATRVINVIWGYVILGFTTVSPVLHIPGRSIASKKYGLHSLLSRQTLPSRFFVPKCSFIARRTEFLTFCEACQCWISCMSVQRGSQTMYEPGSMKCFSIA